MSGNLKERLNDSLIVAAQLWIDTRSQYGEVFEISYELDEVKVDVEGVNITYMRMQVNSNLSKDDLAELVDLDVEFEGDLENGESTGKAEGGEIAETDKNDEKAENGGQ